MLLIKALFVHGFCELQILRKAKKAQWHDWLWPANSSSHSSTAWTCWWISKPPTDYNQQACIWALATKQNVNDITDAFRCTEMYVHWFPQNLTKYHKTVLKYVCSDVLSHYKADRKSLLSLVITGDETWINHFESQKKRQSKRWHHPAPQKFKATRSARKDMATDFWNAKRWFW